MTPLEKRYPEMSRYPRRLKTHHVAEILSIEPRTVLKYREEGRFRGFKIGGKRSSWRFDKVEIFEYLDRQRRQGAAL